MKTVGPVHERSVKLARRLWVAVITAFIIVTVLTWFVRPELLAGIAVRPVTWATMLIGIAGAYAVVNGFRYQREYQALLGSTFVLFGILMTGAAALFPVVLFSTTDANLRLTAADCAAPDYSLGVAAAWWFPALILAVCYLVIIQRHYSGKVNVSKDNQGLY
jgi:cytochrome bd-type quinol oxidase subunit 2